MKRTFSIGQAVRRDESSGDLVVDMAFASEAPYERWWGIEVLQMAGARLGRLNDGDGGPLLFNHDWNDLRGRHVPGSVRADADGVLRGQVLIPQATQATRDAAALVLSRTLTKASVGYQIHKVIELTTDKQGRRAEREIDGRVFERALEAHALVRDGREVGGDAAAFRRSLDAAAGDFERAGDEPSTFLVTDFEPLENSLVTVPADNSVGVGRGAFAEVVPLRAPAQVSQPAATAAQQGVATMADTQTAAAAEPRIEILDDTDARPTPVQLEATRKRAIQNLARAAQCDDRYVQHWIGSGAALEQVAEEIMAIQQERAKDRNAATFLDLAPREVARYSLMRALRAAQNKNWAKAGLELEANNEISKRLSRLPRSETAFFVPLDVMMRDRHQRDMTVAGVSGSNYLVGTANAPGSFIELLRNSSVSLRAGVRRMGGLVGNVTIPKMTAGATAYWLADEGTQITESQPTIGQVSLSPKNVAALTELSHQLLQQSTPDAEQLVLDSIARDIALAVDVGVLRGSGSNGQPQGIVGTSGVGSFTGTSLATAGVLNAQADVAGANALSPGCAYVTTPAVAALLMDRPELTTTGTTPLWVGNMLEGNVKGFRAFSSNQLAAATMLFGWWDTVVLGEWGVLELMTNPYSDFTRGLTAVRGWYTCDVAMRYPAAFSYASSIT